MQIENNFVPYQTALDMKELGFDETCLAFYWNTGKFYTTAEYTSSIKTHKQNQLGDYNYDSTSAPLYSQCFNWFREKYKLHSRIDIQDVKLDLYCYDILEVKEGDYTNDVHTDINFETYKEAELECIKQLIITVKNK